MRTCKRRTSRGFLRQKLVSRDSSLLHEALQQFRRRQVLPTNQVADGRLLHAEPIRKRCLRGARAIQPFLECLHMRKTIGMAYNSAIGSSYIGIPQNERMSKEPTRTFLERAMEALSERFPRDRATQTRLAKIAGVSQPAANEWGQKDRFPEIPTGVRIAKELGVCVEWLYTESGPKYPPPAAEADQFVVEWGKLDDATKRQVASFAKFLKDPQSRQ